MAFHHSVVHSVKGGCGKTTFSVMLAMRQNQEFFAMLGDRISNFDWDTIDAVDDEIRILEQSLIALVSRIEEMERRGDRDFIVEDGRRRQEEELKRWKEEQKKLKTDEAKKLKKTQKDIQAAKVLYTAYESNPAGPSAKKLAEKLKEIRPLCGKTLVIDCDYKGTGMKSAAFGLVDSPKNGASDRPFEYYSNRLLQSGTSSSKVEDYIALKDVLFEGFLGQGLKPAEFPHPPYWSKDAAWLDLMLCDGALSVKNRFIRSEKLVHGMPVQPSVYTAAMGGILDELADLGETKGNDRAYANIVYDLSPGMDEFTEALLDVLAERKKDKKDTIDLYYVTTLDNAHIEATVQHLKRLRDKAEQNISFFNGDDGIHVHVVVNELPTRIVFDRDITLDKLAEALRGYNLDCDIWYLNYIHEWANKQTHHFVKLQGLIERNRKAREAGDQTETRKVADEIEQYRIPFSALHAQLTTRLTSSAEEDSSLFTALVGADYRPWTPPPRIPHIN